MTTYAFLSPEWIEAARDVHARHAADDPGAPGVRIRMNLSVDAVPFEEGTLHAHLDTTSGVLEIALGHLDDADVRVHLDYATARAVIVDANADAAMAAFMEGRIRVEGDIGMLLAYQTTPASPRQVQIAAELREITDRSS